jgi:hypothetical protein
MKMTVVLEVDVLPYTQRTGKGLDYKDTVMPLTAEEADDVVKTYFDIANSDRCQINGHPISFDLKSID